jgi:hypothetical protein
MRGVLFPRGSAGGPVGADERVPAALGTDLTVQFEARTAGVALVGAGSLSVLSVIAAMSRVKVSIMVS